MNDRLKILVLKEDWGKGLPKVFIPSYYWDRKELKQR